MITTLQHHVSREEEGRDNLVLAELAVKPGSDDTDRECCYVARTGNQEDRWAVKYFADCITF